MHKISAAEARARIDVDPGLKALFEDAVRREKTEEDRAERMGYLRNYPEGVVALMRDWEQTVLSQMMDDYVRDKETPPRSMADRLDHLTHCFVEAAILAGILNAADESGQPFETAARTWLKQDFLF